MAITESNYIELMKSCSKFNSRITGERKTRYPYFDQQTGTAHRPSVYAWRKSEQRYPAKDPDYVCSYPAVKWRKNASAPPSDATEMKMFLHNNQQLADAINQTQNYGQTVFGMIPGMAVQQPGNLEAMALIGSSTETSMMMSEPTTERRAATLKREAYVSRTYDDFDDDPDDLSDFGGGDSDDDFGAKRKKGKGGGVGASAKKKKASGGTSGGAPAAPHGASAIQSTPTSSGASAVPAEEKRHACNKCGARYKSRPGLSYHKAHVHGDGVQAPANVLAGGEGGSGSGGKRSRPVPPPLEMPPQDASSSSASSPAILPPPVIFSPSVDISDTCDFCDGTRLENKKTKQPEELVTCHDCGRSGHPSCLNFTENMRLSTSKFGWQCIECKSCAICGTSDNDDQLLFCDDCDRGFHLYCLVPRLEQAPDDAWSCHLCMKVFGSKAAAAQPKK
ncbi:hypothetical protein PFISCL1PPCAC_6814 [Pristionchus fissidentatus]|uniref:Uncharacterized protein n=1 Tax=Pristionchus fissidentatus TaxID=1538716 RepID=A0AAV5V7A8_9BILA|nr:hypothetical protein PFISCL1PPCAC_6814 [Pristionchus fissidentatus]